ncbi:uncharacterized protein K02A2.6-like [Sitodiplosis mosellana]|uniref:uncharacterized protein K02A2.6-like n=1 Tax=Sitodiplosis mosellana TaxID=263140 RepID=UPI002444F157|nr:uncharacterized protein K02A2.6-like [Sitodiplosis mosellana]
MGLESVAKSTTQIVQASSMPEFQVTENWTLWHERFEMHLLEIGCESDTVKISTLLKSIGSEAYGVVHSLCSPTVPAKKSYDDLIALLKQQYTPPKIVFQERKNFYAAKMAQGETVASWFARVKKLAIDCSFDANLDNFVVDKFVCELPPRIFEKLCEEDGKLSSSDALKKAMLRETKLNQQNGATAWSNEVDYVKPRGGGHKQKTPKNNNNSNGTKANNGKCTHCGRKNHASNQCRFKDKACHKCGVIGHLANICSNKAKKNNNSIQYIQNDYNYRDANNFLNSVYSINHGEVGDFDERKNHVYSIGNGADLPYRLTVGINGIDHTCNCDTGAPCSLMSIQVFNSLFDRSILRPCTEPFTGYGGDQLNILGEFKACVNLHGRIECGRIVVTNYYRPTLIGRDFLRKFEFDLVQSNNSVNFVDSYDEIISQIKSDFSEIFKSGLGKCNTTVIKLPLINDATPIFCKARPIPMAFREKIEQQLQQLVEQDIITPVNDSDWGTPIVPIPKSDGEIRICGDYKSTINRFLKDFRYPLPRIEEIFASMQGGQLFTKLDLSGAYNQLVLDDDAQKLCTLSTHKGLFRMKRLPFGVKIAASIFQKTMESLLSQFANVFCFQDDIVVTGNNFAGHLSTLRKVLTKLQEAGLRLNVGKCKFFQSKISYLGFDVDKNGLSKNQERTKSVIDSPQPTNVSELRAFIGMVNHHSKFIPNFAQRMIPLYDLLKKDVDYVWTRACQEAFESMKKEICSDTILAHFDANKPIILTTDACGTAVAGRLSHIFEDGSDRPVAFVSRALNNAEKNYSTFEKEALAIIFSVTKLRQYLLGNKFILRTDHKPLVTIFGENKGIPVMAAARIQRWALLLSGFNYSIEYVKGALNTSDSLSRLRQFETTTIHEEASYINYVGFVNITQIDYKTIALHTRRDPILSKIMDSVQNGTLNNLQGDDFKAYRSKALELSVESGGVLWGYRTIIPSKLQKAVLEALHMSHLGIVKTKSLARSYVYWPNIDKDIEFMIKSCEPCQLTQPNPEKSSLIPWTPTDSAWKRIHIDFAGPIKGFMLFIVIDSFSKWVEVFKTKDITSAFVIAKLRETFCRYGLVDIIVSDNGWQFTSAEFQEFVKQNGINHIFTAPGNPSTNGQAENFVKTLKKSIVANINKHKNIDMDEVLNKFLFDYRITKHCTTNQSPSKIMFGREAKSRFSLMKPPLIRETIIQKNQTAIKNYKGKRNVEFSKGQQVYVRNYKNPNKPSWSPAIVKHKIGPRNYTCLLIRENRDIKRHLNQIRGAVNDDGASETSATLEQNDEVEPTDIVDDEQTGASSEDEETSENEHEASGGGEESFDTANSSNDSVTMADNTLIDGFPMPIPEPQVRQPQRACSKKAAEQITKQLQPNRNR